MLTTSGNRSFSQNAVEPHRGQKRKAIQAPLSQQRAGAPLTVKTMAGRDDSRLAFYPEAQLTAGAGSFAHDSCCHAPRYATDWSHKPDAGPPTIGRNNAGKPRGGRLPKRTKLRVVPTIAIGVLTLVVCAGIGLIYLGGDHGSSGVTNVIGYAAMVLGLVAALMLGIGLVLLINRDKHRD